MIRDAIFPKQVFNYEAINKMLDGQQKGVHYEPIILLISLWFGREGFPE